MRFGVYTASGYLVILGHEERAELSLGNPCHVESLGNIFSTMVLYYVLQACIKGGQRPQGLN